MNKRDVKTLSLRLDEAESYAEKTPSLPLPQKIKTLFLRSRLLTYKGKHQPAISTALKLEKVIEENQDKYRISIPLPDVWNILGILYWATERTDSALYYFQKNLNFYSNEPEEQQIQSIPNVETNIGAVYANRGEFNKALQHFLSALEWRKKQSEIDSANLVVTLRNIGLCYRKKGDYEKQLIYLEEALKINKEIVSKNSYKLVNKYINIATAYKQIGQLEKANRLYEQVYSMTDGIENSFEKSAYIDLRIAHSNYFEAKRDYDKAIELLQEALSYSKRVLGENHRKTASCYTSLGADIDYMS